MGLIGILLLTIGRASAQDDDDARARELYDNGAILYEEGRYEDAVAAFEEAYRLSGRPALLYNIANAQERLGLWTEAHETLSRYRAYATADERETLDRRIFNLERRMAEAPPSKPPGTASSTTVAPASTSRSDSGPGPLVWAFGGGGIVALSAGGVLGGLALDARTEAATLCVDGGDGTLRCPTTAQGAIESDAALSLGADLSLLVGIAGVATGTALLLWGEGGLLSVGPGYVGVSGSF